MHMGSFAAHNIHQLMTAKLDPSHEPRLLELEPVPPMIGLAVGRKALAYSPEMGTIEGEEVMKVYFRDDLGLGSELSFDTG